MNRNKWKEHIIRWCIASGVGAFGGLLLSLTTDNNIISYNSAELMIYGGGAALLSIVTIESMNIKKPSILLMVALTAGLSGPLIIGNAIGRPKIPPILNQNLGQDEPKDKRKLEAPKQGDPGTGEDKKQQMPTFTEARPSEVKTSMLSDTSDLPGPVDLEHSESREAGPKMETPEAREAISSDSVEPENLEKGRQKAGTRALGHDDDQKLKDEYESLEKKRESLEKKRAGYERRTRELESHLRSSQIAYRKCASGEWQVLHKAHLDDAENSRKRLEERNEQLVRLNSELRKRNNQFERQRREIEKRHTIKGEEYRDEMRNWMDLIKVEYFFALENRLFPGYEEYQHGIDLYMIGIDGAAEACQKGGSISRYMETFISFVRELRW